MNDEETMDLDGIEIIEPTTLGEITTLDPLPGLEATLDVPRHHIAARRDERAKEATSLISENSAVRSVWSQTVAPLRDAWKTYREEVASIQEDRTTSPERKDELEVEAAQKRDVVQPQVEEELKERTDAILDFFHEHTLPHPSPELTSEAQLVFTRFGAATGKTFFEEASSMLARASDPNHTDSRKLVHQNQLLTHAYLPLCIRRAESPEPHSRALQPAYEQLAGLIALHLDNTLNGATRRKAVGVVEQALGDFKFMTNTVKRDGWDDLLLSTALRAFDFK